MFLNGQEYEKLRTVLMFGKSKKFLLAFWYGFLGIPYLRCECCHVIKVIDFPFLCKQCTIGYKNHKQTLQSFKVGVYRDFIEKERTKIRQQAIKNTINVWNNK